jgi:hypothetical protein
MRVTIPRESPEIVRIMGNFWGEKFLNHSFIAKHPVSLSTRGQDKRACLPILHDESEKLIGGKA